MKQIRYSNSTHANRMNRIAKDSFDAVIEMNIDKPGTLTFKAAVILVFVGFTGRKYWGSISEWLGYKREDIELIYSNWDKNGLLEDDMPVIEADDTDISWVISITLTAMAGAGKIIRMQIPKALPPPEYVQLPPLIIPTQLLLPESIKQNR